MIERYTECTTKLAEFSVYTWIVLATSSPSKGKEMAQ